MARTEKLIAVSEADELIAAAIEPLPTEEVFFREAYGRVLREDIVADRDQPPFHRVTMDGFALAHEAWSRGVRRFRVQATQAAGDPPLTLEDSTACIEIMTGAVLPAGCDCVVRSEDVTLEAGAVIVADDAAVEPMRHVHERGSDCGAGEVLVSEGSCVTPPVVSIAAAVGKATLRVAAVPAVAVVSTGDELVDVDEPVAPHQIRRSNLYAIEAALRAYGIPQVHMAHAPDRAEPLRLLLAEILAEHAVLVVSGGVSRGRFDLVPDALKAVGVEQRFHRVAQQPGKPMWFGVGPKRQLVFALPGNPVSSLVCLHRYVLPALDRAAGRSRRRETVILGGSFHKPHDLTYFLPVSIDTDDGGTQWATPWPTNTSGDFVSLAETAGFVELESFTREFPEAFPAPLYRWSK